MNQDIYRLQDKAKNILNTVSTIETSFRDIMEEPKIKDVYDELNSIAYTEYTTRLNQLIKENMDDSIAHIIEQKQQIPTYLDAVEGINFEIAYKTITENKLNISNIILTEYLLFKSLACLMEFICMWAQEKIDQNYTTPELYSLFQLFMPAECNPFSGECIEPINRETYSGLLKDLGKFNPDVESISDEQFSNITNAFECFLLAIDHFNVTFNQLGTSPNGLDYFKEYLIIARIDDNYPITSVQSVVPILLTCQDTIPLFMHLNIKHTSALIEKKYLPSLAKDFELYMYGRDGHCASADVLNQLVEEFAEASYTYINNEFIAPLNMNSERFTVENMFGYANICRSVATDD